MQPSYATFLKFHEEQLRKKRDGKESHENAPVANSEAESTIAKKQVIYEPYTIREYKLLKNEMMKKTHPSLGVDQDDPDLAVKREARERLVEYGKTLRMKNSMRNSRDRASGSSTLQNRRNPPLNPKERPISAFETRKNYGASVIGNKSMRKKQKNTIDISEKASTKEMKQIEEIPEFTENTAPDEENESETYRRIEQLTQQHEKDKQEVLRIVRELKIHKEF